MIILNVSPVAARSPAAVPIEGVVREGDVPYSTLINDTTLPMAGRHLTILYFPLSVNVVTTCVVVALFRLVILKEML